MICTEDYFLLIIRLDINVVEIPVYIELCKILSILEFYNKLRDQ